MKMFVETKYLQNPPHDIFQQIFQSCYNIKEVSDGSFFFFQAQEL